MNSQLLDHTTGSPVRDINADQAMRKTELLEYLCIYRGLWNALIESVGEEHMTRPGAEGHWSVKDIVSHVTAYEAWLVEWLGAAALNGFPGPSLLDDPDIERRNAQVYKATRALELDEVLSEAHQIFIRLLKAIKSLPDQYFDDPESGAWFMEPYWSSTKTVSQAIVNLTARHYEEHIPAIQMWIRTETLHEN